MRLLGSLYKWHRSEEEDRLYNWHDRYGDAPISFVSALREFQWLKRGVTPFERLYDHSRSWLAAMETLYTAEAEHEEAQRAKRNVDGNRGGGGGRRGAFSGGQSLATGRTRKDLELAGVVKRRRGG